MEVAAGVPVPEEAKKGPSPVDVVRQRLKQTGIDFDPATAGMTDEDVRFLGGPDRVVRIAQEVKYYGKVGGNPVHWPAMVRDIGDELATTWVHGAQRDIDDINELVDYTNKVASGEVDIHKALSEPQSLEGRKLIEKGMTFGSTFAGEESPDLAATLGEAFDGIHEAISGIGRAVRHEIIPKAMAATKEVGKVPLKLTKEHMVGTEPQLNAEQQVAGAVAEQLPTPGSSVGAKDPALAGIYSQGAQTFPQMVQQGNLATAAQQHLPSVSTPETPEEAKARAVREYYREHPGEV